MFLRTDVEAPAVHNGMPQQQEPYVCVLIRGLPEHLRDLEMHQKLQVYEGVGQMIGSEQDMNL